MAKQYAIRETVGKSGDYVHYIGIKKTKTNDATLSQGAEGWIAFMDFKDKALKMALYELCYNTIETYLKEKGKES